MKLSEGPLSNQREEIATTARNHGVSAGLAPDASSTLKQMLVAVLAFREGEFSARLPTDWTGTEGRIAEAFNRALGTQQRITQEITRLSATVGKDGQLKQRMTLPGAVGGWAVQTDALNTLLDDLVRPTTDVARTIGAVAKGDLGQSMDLEVDGRALKGEFLRANKSETFDCLKFTLEGAGERSHGIARTTARLLAFFA